MRKKTRSRKIEIGKENDNEDETKEKEESRKEELMERWQDA